MMIEVLKSKIHCARVTEANLNYMGSITIDEDLMDAANMIAGEKVYIADNNNGERFETYIIKGERGSGKICLNGAAARKVQPDDIVIIMSYALMDFEEAKSFKPHDILGLEVYFGRAAGSFYDYYVIFVRQLSVSFFYVWPQLFLVFKVAARAHIAHYLSHDYHLRARIVGGLEQDRVHQH